MDNKMGKSVEMIFFDAGETLIHPVPSFAGLLSSICEAYGFQVDVTLLPDLTRALMADVEERQKMGFTFTNNPQGSRRFWIDFYEELLRGLGYDGEDGMLPEELYHTFSDPSHYDLYDDVSETLEELRKRGFRLGLISNFEVWLEDLLQMLELDGFFELKVISGREKFEKPHPKIFEIALKRGGVEPHLAIHVGDSPISDFEGARQAGMGAILLDRWERFPHFEGLKIKTLAEMLSLLE